MLPAQFLAGWFDGNPPPHDQLERFAASFRPREIAARTLVVRAGTSPQEFGLVREGLLRMFYIRRDGREFNKSFLTTGDLFGAPDTLIGGEPTRMWIETLETSTVVVAGYGVLTDMYALHPGWERLGRRMVESLAIKKFAREASLLMDSAAQRYQTFLDEHGAIENRIPDYHIASYLGISAEALCRLKKARLRSRRPAATSAGAS